MTAEELVAVVVRGVLQGLTSVQPAVVTPTAPARVKARRPCRGRGNPADPPAGTTVIPGDMPKPGFDHVDEPLPGFESVPRATLAEMERAMEKITRGNTVPPGFYDPNEADQRAPLS